MSRNKLSLEVGPFDKVLEILKLGILDSLHSSWEGICDIYYECFLLLLKYNDVFVIYKAQKAKIISLFCRMVLCFMYKPRSAYKQSRTLTMVIQHQYYDRVPIQNTKNGSSKKEVDPDVI